MKKTEQEFLAIHAHACLAVAKHNRRLTPDVGAFWPLYLDAALNVAGAAAAARAANAPQGADNSTSVAAIQFALGADEGMSWLRLWNEGEFEACRREWPESPAECYIGADQFFAPPAQSASGDQS